MQKARRTGCEAGADSQGHVDARRASTIRTTRAASAYRLKAQIECGRRRGVERWRGNRHWPWRVTVRPEARVAARFGLVRVHRKGIVVASAGMRDVIGAAAQRTARPGVDEIEH